MGSQKICLLLIVFFMYLYMFAGASTPLRNKAFPSGNYKIYSLILEMKTVFFFLMGFIAFA